jgi:hypothetical protein
MIKNTIIIILLLLLLITFYAYICLSTNMVDFQKERLSHILKKETEITHKEKKLLLTSECNDNLNKYKTMIDKITTDISKTSDDINILTKYASQINNSIKKDIENKTNNRQTTETKISSEKIESEKEHFGNINSINNFDNFEKFLDLPID